jgi:signal transduction histidine kinase
MEGPTLRPRQRWLWSIALAALVALALLVDHVVGPRFVIASFTMIAASAFALGLVSSARGPSIDERARLEAMMERLRESDRQKDVLLATLAHELRNPLAPIRSGIDVLRRSEGTPENARVIAIMDRHLKHMVRLVDDLLDASRLSRGKIELEHRRLSITNVVENAIEAVRPNLDAREQRLVLDFPDDPPVVFGDLTRLAQVVTNLLHNASKFSESRTTIRVEVIGKDEEAIVCVRDEGHGIAPEALDSIFDLFTQTEGGLGIGLALSRTLVCMHGGSLVAASDGLGTGSTFTMSLPRAVDERPSVLETCAAPYAGEQRRILVVDDNADGAELLVSVLGMTGHEVKSASDGAHALETAEGMGPDLVILDIGLPDIDGWEVARRLRLTPKGQKAMLVALTGWGSDEAKQKSLDAGFDLHLTKPVDPRRLLELVSTLPRH